MQLLKSISATFVVVAGRAFKAAAVESFDTICSDGVQSGVPPLRGTAALASTVKSTSPVAGVEYLNPEEEKIPTLGLLAGTTSVYWAQFAFAGAPVGQLVLAETETRPVESTSGEVVVAGLVCSGIVIWRVVVAPVGTVCNADRLTSIVPPAAPFVAVTNPWKTAGAVAPTSAIKGMAPRFVPFGTFRTVVAL